jgi:hypothetical protein
MGTHACPVKTVRNILKHKLFSSTFQPSASDQPRGGRSSGQDRRCRRVRRPAASPRNAALGCPCQYPSDPVVRAFDDAVPVVSVSRIPPSGRDVSRAAF